MSHFVFSDLRSEICYYAAYTTQKHDLTTHHLSEVLLCV